MNKTEINSDTEKELMVTMGKGLGQVGEISDGDKEAQNLNYKINYSQG